jgi:GT2 family glycosyltransferase
MAQAAATDPRVRVLRDERPFNFAALNNAAVRQARGEVLALVNNDVDVLAPGWLAEMVSLALQPGVGAVGARLWYEDFTLQHGGVLLGIGEVAAHVLRGLPRGEGGPAARALRLQGYLAVTAACLVLRREHWDRVGGMDETLAVAFNDIDLCLKLAAAGLRNLWTPHAELIHFESVSRGRDHDPAKKARYLAEAAVMLQRWGPCQRCSPRPVRTAAALKCARWAPCPMSPSSPAAACRPRCRVAGCCTAGPATCAFATHCATTTTACTTTRPSMPGRPARCARTSAACSN